MQSWVSELDSAFKFVCRVSSLLLMTDMVVQISTPTIVKN